VNTLGDEEMGADKQAETAKQTQQRIHADAEADGFVDALAVLPGIEFGDVFHRAGRDIDVDDGEIADDGRHQRIHAVAGVAQAAHHQRHRAERDQGRNQGAEQVREGIAYQAQVHACTG
jgi:hypothetical protein